MDSFYIVLIIIGLCIIFCSSIMSSIYLRSSNTHQDDYCSYYTDTSNNKIALPLDSTSIKIDKAISLNLCKDHINGKTIIGKCYDESHNKNNIDFNVKGLDTTKFTVDKSIDWKYMSCDLNIR